MSKVVVLNYENEHTYNLLGLHTSLEDYRLAFFLNSALDIKLKRHQDDLDFDVSPAHFSLYTFDCSKTFTYWSLIANKHNYINDNSSENGLFNEQSQTLTLIQEKKQVDFFLKVEAELNMPQIEIILSKINSIRNIVTSYSIAPKTLKSRDFLIF